MNLPGSNYIRHTTGYTRRLAATGGIGLLAALALFSGAKPVLAVEPVCTTSTTVNCTFGGFEIDGNTTPSGALDWTSSPAVYGSDPYTPFYDLYNSHSDNMMGQGSKESTQSTWSCLENKPPGKSDLGGPWYTAESGQFAPSGGKSWAGAIWFQTTGGKQYLYGAFQRTTTNGDVHIDYEFNKATTTLNCGTVAKPFNVPDRSQGDVLITFDTSNGGAQIAVDAFEFHCATTTAKGDPCPNNGAGTFEQVSGLVSGSTFDGTANIAPAGSDSGVDAGAFGEAGLNLTDTIGDFTCGEFGKTWMKTRSAGTSDIANGNAEVKDFTTPVGFNPGLCPESTLDKYQANETVQAPDANGTDESGATDQTADAALTFNQRCSTSTSVGAGCATGASTTPMDASPGDQIVYKLVYKNIGGGDAPNPVVTDTIPSGTSYVAGSQTTPTGATVIAADNTSFDSADPCSSTAGTGTITHLVWCLPVEGPTGAGTGVAMYFEVNVDATATTAGDKIIKNFGTVTDTEEVSDTGGDSNYVAAKATYQPDSSIGKKEADIRPLNQYCNTATGGAATSNQACASLPGTEVAPVFVTGPIDVTPGDVVEYQLVYTNDGTAPATNVQVSDDIPAGSTYVASSCSPTCTPTGTPVTSLSWTFASVAPSATKTMTFKVKLDSTFANGKTDTVENFAGLSTTEEGTLDDSNTVVADVTATGVLALVKSASVSEGQITYTIAYFNTGNGDLTDQTISDVIPSGLAFVSCAGGTSTCAEVGGTVTWTVDVAAGTTAASPAGTLTLVVEPS